MGRASSPRLPRAVAQRRPGQVIVDVRPIAERLAAEHDVIIWDLAFTRNVLSVSIDTSAGIGIDVISAYASALSDALDESDVIPGGGYGLEVGSPGAERPLRRPEEFVFCIGREARLTFKTEREPLVGELQGVDDTGVVVAGEHISFDVISQARLSGV